jgi:hypothetical protein
MSISSFIAHQRKDLLFCVPGCELQRRADVVGLEVGIEPQNFLCGVPGRKHPENHADRHSHAADARLAAHHSWVGGYAFAPVHDTYFASTGPRRKGAASRLRGKFEAARGQVRAATEREYRRMECQTPCLLTLLGGFQLVFHRRVSPKILLPLGQLLSHLMREARPACASEGSFVFILTVHRTE